MGRRPLMETPKGEKEPEDSPVTRQPALTESKDLKRMVEVVGGLIEQDVAKAGADKKPKKTVRRQVVDILADLLSLTPSPPNEKSANHHSAVEAEGKPQRIPIDAKIKARDGKGLS